jgi:hypothetical protein
MDRCAQAPGLRKPRAHGKKRGGLLLRSEDGGKQKTLSRDHPVSQAGGRARSRWGEGGVIATAAYFLPLPFFCDVFAGDLRFGSIVILSRTSSSIAIAA